MTDQTIKPRLGSLQVNATDYGDIVIECFGYAGGFDGPIWMVPAWEEQGRGDLAGPFSTVAAAKRALREAF
jgi:hypothetical protein